MNNKDVKEPIPEKKYVAFHRERQEPIDCFTRHEVDKKLKAVQEGYDKKLQGLKDEITESRKEDIEKVKAQFDSILKKISEKFKEYYPQEKVDQFFNVLNSGTLGTKWRLEEFEKQLVKLEALVLKYLEATDIGENIDGSFVFNEKKKKRFWNK